MAVDQLVIRAALRDEVSKPLERIILELQATRAEAERLRAETEKQTKVLGQHTNAYGRAEKAASRFGLGLGGVRKLAGLTTSALVKLTKVGFLGLAGAAAVAAYGVYKVGSAYQDSVNTFQAVTRASTSQMARMSATARLLGQDMTLPATSAADAASAMTELAKGGLSVDSSMKAAKGTLQLAAAAQIDAAKAATIQVNTLNQFGLAAGKASHVADLLANTANASSGEITDMSAALNYFGPVARAFGVTVDSASAAIGVLGNAGIMGSMAGTSLRSSLVNLAKPTKLMQSGIKELNLQLFDQKGHFLGLRAMTDQLWQAQKRMNPKEFNAALSKTFGKQNLAAIAALAQAGPRAYDKMAYAVGRVGGAADVAQAKTKGLKGAVEGLKSQLETVAIDVWTKTSPTIDRWVRGWAEAIPGVEKSVGGFLKRTAGQGQALFHAAKTGNSKWAGHVLAQASGQGTGADWQAGLQQAGSVVTDLSKVFSGVLLPIIKMVAQYWKLLLVPVLAFRKALSFVANNTTLVRRTLLVLLAAFVLYRTAVVGLMVIDRARAALAWLNVVRQKQAVGATYAQRLAILAVRAATMLWAGAQWALTAAWNASPIGVVILAIAALVAGVIYAYTHWKWFRRAVDATWKALQSAWHWLVKAWNAAYAWVKGTGVLQKAWGGIKDAIGWVRDVVADLWQKFKDVLDIAGKVGDKVGGAISKVTGAVSKVGSFAGKFNPFGDTATPKARGGSIGNTMGAAAALSRGVPGQRFVTSGVRGHSLGSPGSDHATGRALDLIGSNLAGYASAVRKAGGYAAFHGDGLSRHLHIALGDQVRGSGSLPGAVGPYGDTAIPHTRSGQVVGGSGGGVLVMPGGVQVYVTGGDGLTPDQLAAAVARGISDYERDRVER